MTEKIKLPQDFKSRILNFLGSEAEEFENSLSKPSPVSIRINKNKNKNFTTQNESVNWCKTGQYLSHRPIFTLDPFFQGGLYYVQEASSMFLEQIMEQTLDLSERIKVLDLCAAPGGKSTHIDSLISSDSLLISNEVIRSRVNILEQNIAKWGTQNVFITNNDPKDFSVLKNYFDVIIIDAPCSGEGMFRKTPEAINEWSIDNVKLCASRQKRILSDVIDALKPGGVLIYSTCTFNEEENEDNINWIINTYEDFESVKINTPKNWNILETKTSNEQSEIYSYRFYPHRIKGEGFFTSCLRKKDTENGIQSNYKSKPRQSNESVQKKLIPLLQKWIKNPTKYSFLNHNNEVYAIINDQVDDFEKLKRIFNIRHAGINMGKLMREELLPSHYLALNTSICDEIQKIEVNLEQALLFMKREDFNFQTTEMKGWALISYDGINLGWIKILNNRINNYFPKEWRIRMAID